LVRAFSAALIAAVLAIATGAPALAQTIPDMATAGPETSKPTVNAAFGSASVSFVDLRGEDRTWSLVGGGVALNTSGQGVTTAEAQRTARPGLENLRASLRHDEQLSNDIGVYVQVSASTGDPLREEWGVGAGIVQRISAQLQLTLDARAARYATLDPAAVPSSFVGLAVNPGVVLSPRGTPLELSAQAIILRNDRKEWQVGGAVRALWYTGDRDFFMAGLSRYPENELGVVRQLTSVYAGLRRDLGQGIGLRITAEHADLEGAWEARTLTISLEKRF
jgi:YaiO family outer membrane protein